MRRAAGGVAAASEAGGLPRGGRQVRARATASTSPYRHLRSATTWHACSGNRQGCRHGTRAGREAGREAGVGEAGIALEQPAGLGRARFAEARADRAQPAAFSVVARARAAVGEGCRAAVRLARRLQPLLRRAACACGPSALVSSMSSSGWAEAVGRSASRRDRGAPWAAWGEVAWGRGGIRRGGMPGKHRRHLAASR